MNTEQSIKVTETKSEGLKRHFKIAVAASEIEAQVHGRLKELARTAQLPGFRPGKAPIPILKKKFGPSVRGEVMEQAINDASSKILSERDLQPALQPKIKITTFEDGGDLEYTMAIEVVPVVEPGDFSKIKLQRMTAVADQTRIDYALERLANDFKTSEKLTTKRGAKTGDIAVIDFVGKVGGKEFPGGKAEDYVLDLGSGSFIPGFEDQLVGAKAGDQVVVKVTFPAEYGATDLVGKEAEFDVTIKELQSSKPAPIDDELAKKTGKSSLRELKESLHGELDRHFEEVSHQRLKRSLLDTLAAGHDFEIPEGLLEQETASIWAQYAEVLKTNPEDEEIKGKTYENLKVEFQSIAERRVRLGILLSEVGRRNDLHVSQQEINKAIMKEARDHPGREHEILEFYKTTPDALERIREPLLENKVVDFILEHAKIDEKKVSIDELMAEPEKTPAPAAKTKSRTKTAKGKKKKPVAKKAASKRTAAGKK